MTNYAPIALFVYNRPKLTSETLFHLSRNELAAESILYVFSDGPKKGASEEDIQKIMEVRRLVKETSWSKELHIYEKEENAGLAKSIISGVNHVISKHGKVIVLEDDLITSSHFLKFMNTGIEQYSKFNEVASIHGFIYPFKQDLDEPFFLKGADCLGWATWASAWENFEPDGRKLAHLLFSRNLYHEFDLGGEMNFSGMLMDQILGKNNSWAIRWHASAFLANKLTLYSNHSLIHHIGTGEDATHSSHSDALSKPIVEKEIRLPAVKIEESLEGNKALREFFRALKQKDPYTRPSFIIGRKQKIKNVLKSILQAEKSPFGWKGDFQTFEMAKAHSKGYNQEGIVQKAMNSALLVVTGEKPYERDGMVFEKLEHNWPLASALQKIAAEFNNSIEVCDFGGAFGSSYFQNRNLFNSSAQVKWHVIEQNEFVRNGKLKFENDKLKFHYSIGEMEEEGYRPHVLLLSSVLQYLDYPYKWLNYFLALGYPYLLIDRTSFISGPYERITVQTVPPEIYEASYPCHFFKEEKLLEILTKHYDLISDFPSFCDNPSVSEDGNKQYWKGYFLKRKS